MSLEFLSRDIMSSDIMSGDIMSGDIMSGDIMSGDFYEKRYFVGYIMSRDIIAAILYRAIEIFILY